MVITSIFITKEGTRYCKWCHKPIPSSRASNAKYCSDNCSRRGRAVYQRDWARQKNKKLKGEMNKRDLIPEETEKQRKEKLAQEKKDSARLISILTAGKHGKEYWRYWDK